MEPELAADHDARHAAGSGRALPERRRDARRPRARPAHRVPSRRDRPSSNAGWPTCSARTARRRSARRRRCRRPRTGTTASWKARTSSSATRTRPGGRRARTRRWRRWDRPRPTGARRLNRQPRHRAAAAGSRRRRSGAVGTPQPVRAGATHQRDGRERVRPAAGCAATPGDGFRCCWSVASC